MENAEQSTKDRVENDVLSRKPPAHNAQRAFKEERVKQFTDAA
jgi:hypothetical protein